MPADNSAHLRAAAQRSRQTLQRARDALRQLEAGGRPVTFELVARAAGVSRAWLYSQPDIRQAVQQLRAAHRLAPADPSPPRNALPMPASCAGWKPPTPETGNSPPKSASSANNWPAPTDNSARLG